MVASVNQVAGAQGSWWRVMCPPVGRAVQRRADGVDAVNTNVHPYGGVSAAVCRLDLGGRRRCADVLIQPNSQVPSVPLTSSPRPRVCETPADCDHPPSMPARYLAVVTSARDRGDID